MQNSCQGPHSRNREVKGAEGVRKRNVERKVLQEKSEKNMDLPYEGQRLLLGMVKGQRRRGEGIAVRYQVRAKRDFAVKAREKEVGGGGLRECTS